MRLYIWEGNGISGAYHDDGTLVVLAESPEQARQVVRDKVADFDRRHAAFVELRDAYMAELKAAGASTALWHTTERGKAIWDSLPGYISDFFDGADSALDQDPTRVVEVDQPTWVAFNGGGYD